MSGHHRWEDTKRGGRRRTGIAQKAGLGDGNTAGGTTGSADETLALGKSTSRINWRRAVRIPHPVLKLNEKLGLPECPYVIRWRLEFPFGSIRVHHWLSNDDNRAVHDHPWWFLTFVVKGGYTDSQPGKVDVLTAPAVRFRKAEHRHTVFPHPGGAWTILITGRPLRKWGFWHKDKFIKANKWFLTFGHHPCN